jgi:hypothetical protein
MNGLKSKSQANKLEDSDFKCSLDGKLQSSRHESLKEEIQNSQTIDKKEYDSGEAGMKDIYHNLNTLTSNRTSSPGIKDNASESFIPFSQQTSLTHAPALYEELIQKYEGDIRNHIRIEQQMKLHSDSVVSKLEDKEKEFEKMSAKLKELKK